MEITSDQKTVVVYSFYWCRPTNDDEPHHFTQTKYKETVIKKYFSWLRVQCRL